MLRIHTAKDICPIFSDRAAAAKSKGGGATLRIGDPVRWRILIRGEAGMDIIHELYPLDSEIVIDKPQGRVHATAFADVLQKYGIENLLVRRHHRSVRQHQLVR